MTSLVLTIRPEPGCSATVRVGRLAGLPIEGCPLFEIRPLAWKPPEPRKIDALLLGSANAVRHGGPGLDLFRDKPVYAVGSATAREASKAGFAVADWGKGGLQRIVNSVRPPAKLLRLAGRERVALSPPLGVAMETRTVYESVPRPLPGQWATALSAGGLVLLHSAAAARHFASECDRCGLSRAEIALAALGSRIAAAAGEGWRIVRAAVEPREAALLALARDLCHELRPR